VNDTIIVTGLDGEQFKIGCPLKTTSKREFYIETFKFMANEADRFWCQQISANNAVFKCLLHGIKWAGAIQRHCNVDQYLVKFVSC
jgi:hypothetical protein